MKGQLSDERYQKLTHPNRGYLHVTHGVSSEFGRRKGYEQEYFLHHKALGVKLPPKYSLR